MDLPDILYWHWLILGVFMLVLELFVPGSFFIWLGVASLIVGGITFLLPTLSLEIALLLFAVLSVITAVLGRKYLKKHPIETDRPNLNRRGEQYIGRVFTLESPIINGQGKVVVDDSTWKVSGDDCPAGTTVEVIGIERGTVLVVRQK